MIKAKKMYARRKAMIIRVQYGTRCPTFHPLCVQCRAWQMPARERWARALLAHNNVETDGLYIDYKGEVNETNR